VPGIARKRRGPPSPAAPIRGMHSSRPRVYGWRGGREELRRGRLLGDAAGVEHERSVAVARHGTRDRA
jgi:hypothetical protein